MNAPAGPATASPPDRATGRPRRELMIAAALCLAGAGLALLAGSQPWATVHVADSGFATKSVTGGDLTGAVTALGLAGLAGLAALFAVSGRIRAGLGVLVALFGVGLIYFTATSSGHDHVVSVAGSKSQSILMAAVVQVDSTGWPVVSVVGGALLVAAGLLVAVRGSRWPGMSSRYERTSNSTGAAVSSTSAPSPAEPDSAGLWKALDRGEDPTGN